MSGGRTLWVTIIAVLVVIALGIVGYYFYLQGNSGSLVQQQLQQSTDAFNQNNFQGAITNADTALTADPNNVQALLAKAFALAQEGSITFQENTYGQQAITVAQQVLAIDPNSDEAYRAMGYANEIMQNYTAAHQDYEKAISINPQNALAIADNAHAYDLQGDFTDAQTGYEQALKLDPTLDLALLGMGRIYLREGNATDAVASFEAAATSSPNIRSRSEGAYSAGLIEIAENNYVAATQLMNDATTDDPSYSLAWAGTGDLLFQQAIATSSSLTVAQRNALVDQSFQDLNHAVTLNPQQSYAYYLLGTEFFVLGRNQSALAVFTSLETTIPNDITLSAPDKQTMLTEVAALIKHISAS